MEDGVDLLGLLGFVEGIVGIFLGLGAGEGGAVEGGAVEGGAIEGGAV